MSRCQDRDCVCEARDPAEVVKQQSVSTLVQRAVQLASNCDVKVFGIYVMLAGDPEEDGLDRAAPPDIRGGLEYLVEQLYGLYNRLAVIDQILGAGDDDA